MFYASTAHICNDWLAIPLFTLFLAAAVRGRPAAFLSLLSAGLLAKAYFLTLVPIAATGGLAVSGRDARLGAGAPGSRRGVVRPERGPLRQRERDAGGARRTALASVIEAAKRVPWATTVATSAHAALWAGNNSDVSFHRRTIDGMLLLLVAGALCFRCAPVEVRDLGGGGRRLPMWQDSDSRRSRASGIRTGCRLRRLPGSSSLSTRRSSA